MKLGYDQRRLRYAAKELDMAEWLLLHTPPSLRMLGATREGLLPFVLYVYKARADFRNLGSTKIEAGIVGGCGWLASTRVTGIRTSNAQEGGYGISHRDRD